MGDIGHHHADAIGNARPRRWRYVAALAAMTVLFVAGMLLPVRRWLGGVLEWVEGLDHWAPPVVAGLYVVATVLLLPGGILTMAAGFLFGVVTGTVAVSVGSTLGATVAFLVGRTVARDWVRHTVADRPRFAAIDRAVSEQGFTVVLLTRLSPVFPFNLQNYAYGLTGVAIWKYVLASWIGMLPGTVAYCYIGSGLRSLTEIAAGQTTGGWVQRAVFWGGLAATLAVVVFVTRVAGHAMKRAAPGTDHSAQTSERPQ